ncbi:signal peptidase I [Enterococcus sp. UD-01]|jgi:signal peptidase|uniref:signal peptidase I n=1 Tax=Enterococcus sp. UD-01 TaxID=3373911 RepID=UPI003835E634
MEERKRKPTSTKQKKRTTSSKQATIRQPNQPKKLPNAKKKRPAKKAQKDAAPQAPKKKVRKPVKKNPVYTFLFNLIFYSFILFMVIGSVLFATSKSTDRSVLGYRFFGVLTDSMVPRDPKTQKGGFHSGDIIIVKNIKGSEAQVGDIITFRPSLESKAFLTHRVKKKLDHLGETKGTYYITQGDANLAEDVPVNAKQVVGKKIFVIPKIGAVLTFVHDHPITAIIFLLSVFGFITVVRYYILNKG